MSLQSTQIDLGLRGVLEIFQIIQDIEQNRRVIPLDTADADPPSNVCFPFEVFAWIADLARPASTVSKVQTQNMSKLQVPIANFLLVLFVIVTFLPLDSIVPFAPCFFILMHFSIIPATFEPSEKP